MPSRVRIDSFRSFCRARQKRACERLKYREPFLIHDASETSNPPRTSPCDLPKASPRSDAYRPYTWDGNHTQPFRNFFLSTRPAPPQLGGGARPVAQNRPHPGRHPEARARSPLEPGRPAGPPRRSPGSGFARQAGPHLSRPAGHSAPHSPRRLRSRPRPPADLAPRALRWRGAPGAAGPRGASPRPPAMAAGLYLVLAQRVGLCRTAGR